MKRRVVLALAIAVGLLGLFVVAVGWESVLASIRRANLGVYALAFLAITGCLGFRTLVWHRVLAVVDEPRPYWLVAGVFLTATFAKYVTPYGQVASGVGVAAIVSRYYDSEYEEGLAATVSADVLNYLPYYTFGGIAAVYVVVRHSPPVDVGRYALVVVLAVSAVGVAVVAFRRRTAAVREVVARGAVRVRGLVARVSERRARYLRPESVRSRFDGFFATLELVRANRGTMGVALAYAHLSWLGLAAALFVSAHALGLEVGFGVAMLCVALSKLGFLVPTPGGVGGVEVALTGVLYLLTPATVALATAVAILFRFAAYWFPVLVGGTASILLTLTDPRPPEAYEAE